MSKQVIYDEQAREQLIVGALKVAASVASTLGPHGNNVILDKGYGEPVVTKDGVTVAKAFALEDPVQNMGARLMIQASAKTNDLAGDGTTTSAVLAASMVINGHLALKPRLFKNKRHDIQQLKQGMDDAAKAAIENLKKTVTPADTLDMLESVATISANNDVEIGKLVADVAHKTGLDGVIAIEDSQGTGITTEHVEGMRFDRGYISPYLVTKELECDLREAHVLITDERITTNDQIKGALEYVAKNSKQLFIVCEDLSGEALQTCVVNHLRGVLRVNAVRPPAYGDRRRDSLLDLSALCGATLVSKDTALDLAEFKPEWLGKCDRVYSDANKTTIVHGHGTQEAIKERVDQCKTLIAQAESDFDRERNQERLARLTTGVAVIKVGGATESEAKERKYLVEDAVNAVKASMREGVVAGGGSALLGASPAYPGGKSSDYALGWDIVCKALYAPIKRIVLNSGRDPKKVIARVLEANRGLRRYGYDAKADCYHDDMVLAGVMDPLVVTRSALLNAVSVAACLLTTSCVIYDKEKDKVAER